MIATGMTMLALVVAGLTVALIARCGRTAGGIALVVVLAVFAIEYALASGGVLREWTRRPPPLLLAAGIPILIALGTALGPVGRRIAASSSFAAIIGIQTFRLPLELLMHRAAENGLMPMQMSYSGRNFDILTGILAIPVAILAARSPSPRRVIFAWNLLGTLLLLNIVTVAIASTPIFAAFGQEHLNTWVADPPYVFLPSILVPAAAFCHTLTWRKLQLPKGSPASVTRV